GTWRADTRLLRLVDPSKDQPLTLRWEGKERALRVARVHLFRDHGEEASGIAGLEISGVPATSQVKTFRLDTPDLHGTTPPATVYLRSQDAAGNRTHPIGISGGAFAGGVGNRP